MSTFDLRVGDAKPWLAYTFPGIDLTTVLGVTFSARSKPDNTVFINNRPALVANGTYVIDGTPRVLTPADGIVFYQWSPPDTAVVRPSAEGLFKLQWPDGQETWPSTGTVRFVIRENF